ncbi:MAG: hypothetical protein P4L82_02030, partial [Ancalomicrobiaceae bacterium]|nr:hypothetical protein [Ancalomicrobiaceae bacterium]
DGDGRTLHPDPPTSLQHGCRHQCRISPRRNWARRLHQTRRPSPEGYERTDAFLPVDTLFYSGERARSFPEIESFEHNDLKFILSHIDHRLKFMRDQGFLKECSDKEGREIEIEEMLTAFNSAWSAVESFARMPTKWGWALLQINSDIALAMNGHAPQFIIPKPYIGTKTSSHKHKELRMRTSYAVACLITRGLSRDDACVRVAGALAGMHATTNKNGRPLSSRTIRGWYLDLKRKVEGKENLELKIENMNDDGYKFVRWIKMDIEDFDSKGKGPDHKGFLGVSPIECLKRMVEHLLPIV